MAQALSDVIPDGGRAKCQGGVSSGRGRAGSGMPADHFSCLAQLIDVTEKEMAASDEGG